MLAKIQFHFKTFQSNQIIVISAVSSHKRKKKANPEYEVKLEFGFDFSIHRVTKRDCHILIEQVDVLFICSMKDGERKRQRIEMVALFSQQQSYRNYTNEM